MPFVPYAGERHHLEVSVGSEVVLRMAQAAAGAEREPHGQAEGELERAPAPEPEGAGPVARLRARLAASSPVPLEGGSASLAIGELGRLVELADMCAGEFAVGIMLDAERNDQVLAAAEKVDGASVGRVDGRIEILLDEWATLWKRTREIACEMRRSGTRSWPRWPTRSGSPADLRRSPWTA
jgi:hypothetical protein